MVGFGKYVRGSTIEMIFPVDIATLVAFLRENPSITSVSLSNCKIRDEALKTFVSASPQAIKSLDLSKNELSAMGIAALSEYPVLTLTHLDLSHNSLNAVSIRVLNLGVFPLLKKLNLGSNIIGKGNVCVLEEIDFSGIQFLNLEKNNIDANAARALGSSQFNLPKELDLSYNDINLEAIQNLFSTKIYQVEYINLTSSLATLLSLDFFSGKTIQNIKSLILDDNKISAVHLESLAKAVLPSLTFLSLNNNNIGDRGAFFLSSSSFSGITHLELGNNEISEDGLIDLVKGGFKALTKLNLIDNHIKINISNMEALIGGKLESLTELNVAINTFRNEGAKALAKSNLINLTKLDLSGNCLSAEGAKALANGNLTNLTELNLHNNSIGDEGAKALANGNLINLTKLDLRKNLISLQGLLSLVRGNLVLVDYFNLTKNNINVEDCSKIFQNVSATEATHYKIEICVGCQFWVPKNTSASSSPYEQPQPARANTLMVEDTEGEMFVIPGRSSLSDSTRESSTRGKRKRSGASDSSDQSSFSDSTRESSTRGKRKRSGASDSSDQSSFSDSTRESSTRNKRKRSGASDSSDQSSFSDSTRESSTTRKSGGRQLDLSGRSFRSPFLSYFISNRKVGDKPFSLIKLANCNILLEGLSVIVSAHNALQELTVLNLNNNLIGDQGAIRLSLAPLPQLKELHLSGNDICHRGMLSLANGELKGLTKMVLSNNCSINVQAATAIGCHLTKLELLDLSGVSMKEETLLILSGLGSHLTESKKFILRAKGRRGLDVPTKECLLEQGVHVSNSAGDKSADRGKEILQRIEEVLGDLNTIQDVNHLITLGFATNNQFYRYSLQKHDIAYVARAQRYNFLVGNEMRFRIMSIENGQVSFLKTHIKNFRDEGGIGPRRLILIVNLNGDHWVTLVIDYQNGNYIGYYADSLSNDVTHGIKRALEDNGITLHNVLIDQQGSRLVQQGERDRYNCGFWALENARDMDEVLKRNNNLVNQVRGVLDEMRNSLTLNVPGLNNIVDEKSLRNEGYFQGLRRDISREIKDFEADAARDPESVMSFIIESQGNSGVRRLLLEYLKLTSPSIESLHFDEEQQAALLQFVSSSFPNASIELVKQGLYLPSFEKRGVNVNGKCVAITRSLSQALSLHKGKSLLNNLKTSSEIYERIAQGKQISKREEKEAFTFSKLLSNFEEQVDCVTSTLHSSLTHSRSCRMLSGLSNYIAGINDDFALHLVTSNHVVAIYRIGDNYAYFDSNAAFISELKSVDQLMQVVEKGMGFASYEIGEKGFLIEHFDINQANDLLDDEDKQTLTREIKTERELLAEQDKELGLIKIDGQEVSRVQLYDFGTKINVKGSVPLLINADMKLNSEKFLDYLDKKEVSITAREYLDNLQNSKNVKEVVQATKAIPFEGSNREVKEAEHQRSQELKFSMKQLIKYLLTAVIRQKSQLSEDNSKADDNPNHYLSSVTISSQPKESQRY